MLDPEKEAQIDRSKLSSEELQLLEQAKYRLILVDNLEGEPMLAAQMLNMIADMYDKRQVQMPSPLKEEVDSLYLDIRQELGKLMLEKKKRYDQLIDSRKKIEQQQKLHPRDTESPSSQDLSQVEYLDYGQSIQFLENIERQKGIKLGLSNMARALQLFDSPQLAYKVIHVAGTNGKGSVCSMIDSILMSAGYKTGRYTSPHLIRMNERIMINGKPIGDDKFAELVNRVRPYLRKVDLTYFEIVTLMAFLHFRDAGVDFVVLEVGMGGRLDATNTASPLLAVITNIDLDHTEHLGVSIKEIAYEKAGIIKDGMLVVTGCEGEDLDVIKEVCESRRATILPLMKHKVIGGVMSIGELQGVKLGLKGEFQHRNAQVAATAIKALRNLDIVISDRAIKIGLANAEWPGRLEFLENNVVVDSAHNPAGASVLVREIGRLEKFFDKIILVFGAMRDKDIRQMAEILFPAVDTIILTKAAGERAETPQGIANLVQRQKRELLLANSVPEAIDKARAISRPQDLVLITGSIYVIGEAMQYLKGPYYLS